MIPALKYCDGAKSGLKRPTLRSKSEQEKLEESAVIKEDGKKQMPTGMRDLCVKIEKLADYGWFCCTVEDHGICM